MNISYSSSAAEIDLVMTCQTDNKRKYPGQNSFDERQPIESRLTGHQTPLDNPHLLLPLDGMA
jgi:hypothetical protein